MSMVSRSQSFAAAAALLAALFSAPNVAAQEATEISPAAYCHDTCCEADDGCCDACGDGSCGCSDGCCRKVCVATVETEKVEKHCWKTESRDICIPKVILPWQKGGSGLTFLKFLNKNKQNGCGDACCSDACCDDACGGNCCCVKPRCGKVITVCDLKKEKYEKEECVYKWKIRRLPPCCDDGCCGSGGCGDACGVDGCCDSAWSADAAPVSDEIQLASLFAPEPAPAKEAPLLAK